MPYHRRRQTFEIAYRRELDRAGIHQTDVAAALERSPATLCRMLNSRIDDYRFHVSDLAAAYDVDDGACIQALDQVLAGCGDGVRVVPVAHEEPADLVDGVLDLEASLGQFTASLRAARSPASPGGRSIVRIERVQLAEKLRAARREIDAMLSGLDEAGAA